MVFNRLFILTLKAIKFKRKEMITRDLEVIYQLNFLTKLRLTIILNASRYLHHQYYPKRDLPLWIYDAHKQEETLFIWIILEWHKRPMNNVIRDKRKGHSKKRVKLKLSEFCFCKG